MSNKSPIFRYFCVIFTLLICVFSISAQTTAFIYQGKLTDGATTANGTYEMQFKLFDSLSAGTQIGSTITNNSVTVANGVFTVQLDFGNEFPGTDRWLVISVKKPAEASYTTLSPRQKLASVPYAVQALKAATADVSTDSTNAVNLTGNLSGDVTGTQTATVVSSVGGQTAVNVAAGVTLANAATSQNTADAIVRRDSNGGFSAGAVSVLNNGFNVTVPQDTNTAMTITNPRLTSANQGNYFLKFIGANIDLTSPVDKFKFDISGGFVANGQLGVGFIPTSGEGERMMWHPYRAAFRAGGVNGSQWDDSTIGFYSWAGGQNTTAEGNWSFAFGLNNYTDSIYSTAFGRSNTTVDSSGAEAAFVAGESNTVCGFTGVALGYGNNSGCTGNLVPGTSSSRTADNMSVAIGYRNVASGNYSVAMGKYASTNNFSGTFVWSDASNTNTDTSSNNLFSATANNQFAVKASGGVRFYTNSGLTTGVTLSAGGGSWTSVSDRNAKDNIIAVNPRDILKGVLALPISTWNYKGQSEFRHIGAMAQDFYSTFKVGENDKTITTVDPDGVALAAIQGLNEELKDRDLKIEAQQQQLNSLQEQVKQQQTVINALKKLLCAGNPNADVCK
jgi:hypothetical protein